MDLNKPQPNQTLFKYLKQQKENARFMNSVEIGVTLLVITFFAFMAIRPTVTTIIGLTSEIKVKEKAIKDMKSRINNLVVAQNNFVKVQEELDLINSSLPSRANFGDIADQIEGTSIKTNTSLQGIGLNLNKDSKGTNTLYQYHAVNITGEDQFSDTINFINKFTNNRRVMEIENLNLAKKVIFAKDADKVSSDQNTIVFSLSTKFVSLPENVKK